MNLGFIYRVGTFAGSYEVISKVPIGNFATTLDQLVDYVYFVGV